MTGGRRPPTRTARAAVALALCLGLNGAPGMAQSQAQAPAACPDPQAIEPVQLYGLWQVHLWPEGGNETQPASRGALLFERHPEYPGSVRGELRRTLDGQDLSAVVSGDATDGVFNLDESADGVTMSAVWEGQVQDCGRAIRGTRRTAEGQPATEPLQQFHLFKRAGWQ
jgi:hypothetical protein